MRVLTKSVFFLTFVFLRFVPLCAQEVPPDTPQPSDGQQDVRIVEHRPTGYFLKRALHPFTWVDVGILRPMYRLGTGPVATKFRGSKGPVKIGVSGAGPGSG